VLFKYKTELTMRNLSICFFAFMMMSYSGYAQEKEEKIKQKDEAVELSEEIKIIDISSEDKPEQIPFSIVGIVPYTEECKSFSANDERRDCVMNFIQKHAMRNFNTDLAQELKLPAGNKRILSQFKIDTLGKVIDIKVRAPHPDLEEEVKRIIQLLPKFVPGEHNRKRVVVLYSLPIVFTVEE
jgi:Gram-negative bacterial TonB protein C-terminal